MSFSFGANAGKASDVKKALEDQRDQLLKGEAYNANRAAGADDVPARRAEVEELSAAAVKGAEAAVRALPGAGRYQLSVSGHRNPDGVQSVSVSVTAIP